jgi:hypothetical protein
MLRTLRLLTLIAVALVMGASFAHVLEMGPKLALDAEGYRIVQTIYTSFGPIGRILEPLAIVGALALAYAARGRHSFLPALIGALALVLALIAWAVIVAPMNLRMTEWGSAMSSDWTAVRARWEWGHVVHFLLQLTGFVALLLSVLADVPARRPSSVVARPRAPVSPGMPDAA